MSGKTHMSHHNIKLLRFRSGCRNMHNAALWTKRNCYLAVLRTVYTQWSNYLWLGSKFYTTALAIIFVYALLDSIKTFLEEYVVW